MDTSVRWGPPAPGTKDGEEEAASVQRRVRERGGRGLAESGKTLQAVADELGAYATQLIPTALIADRSGPLAAGDRGQAVGRRRQPVPGLAAGRDDRLVVRPDAMAELVLPQVLPHVLDRVQTLWGGLRG